MSRGVWVGAAGLALFLAWRAVVVNMAEFYGLRANARAFPEAVELYQRALAEAEGPLLPPIHLALSKLYEHRLSRPDVALSHAERATDAEVAEDHARRLERLQSRVSSG